MCPITSRAPTIILLSGPFLLPDVVTWLAPTCDVVNTSSAPTPFADSVTDSCSSLFHYPCPPPHSSPSHLIPSWRSQINPFIPWAACDCVAFRSTICQGASPLLNPPGELLGVRVNRSLGENVLLTCWTLRINVGRSTETTVVEGGEEGEELETKQLFSLVSVSVPLVGFCDTQSAFKMCQQSAKEKLENELGVRLWQLNKMNH